MDGLKIGGVFYGGDIQMAMDDAHRVVEDAAAKVYKNDLVMFNLAKMVIEEYEHSLLELLRGKYRNGD